MTMLADLSRLFLMVAVAVAMSFCASVVRS